MHVLKFIVLMFFIFVMFHITKYYHSLDYNKDCSKIYIPLIDKYKDSNDINKHFKGYENDDNLSFLKYEIK
jgi:hypothetical protein